MQVAMRNETMKLFLKILCSMYVRQPVDGLNTSYCSNQSIKLIAKNRWKNLEIY